MMYLYESHIYGYYVSKTKLAQDKLYCFRCQDWDTYMGQFLTAREVLMELADEILVDGEGRFPVKYFTHMFTEFGLIISEEEVVAIVRESRSRSTEVI